MGLLERVMFELATPAGLLFADNLPLISDDVTIEQFLPVLSGHKTVFPAGERFQYNNGGYVALALLAERATGMDFQQLVHALVCEPAGTRFTVLGSGDGGIYSTAGDN